MVFAINPIVGIADFIDIGEHLLAGRAGDGWEVVPLRKLAERIFDTGAGNLSGLKSDLSGLDRLLLAPPLAEKADTHDQQKRHQQQRDDEGESSVAVTPYQGL